MKKSAFLILILFSLTAAAAQELYDAVKAGDLSKVRQIVERDPKIVNIPNQNGETILFGAIMPGRAEIVQYLISRGAEVNRMNNFDMAPLHLACRRNLPLEIIRVLVENGADVNAVSKYQGRPLDMAYENGDEPVIRYLTSKGAVPTALEFETFKLAGGLHRLAYPWGMRNNLIVSTGPDGVLIVDTGFNRRALDVARKLVAGFGGGDIRYVINTHSDWDHVAGNGLAPSESAVIGLEKLEILARDGQLTRSDKERVGPGGRSLPAPYLLRFNNQEVELYPYPGLHSDVDILIHFPKARVLCMGDLLLSQSCPAIRGAAEYLGFLDKVLDVFPPGTTFVSGHGRDLDLAGLRKYRDDMAEMAGMIRKEHAAGRTAEDMIRADLLKKFKPEYSQLDWLGPDSWIQRVVRGQVGSALETLTVKIPQGKGDPVLLDGSFSAGEWDDAWQRDLGSGVTLYLKKMGGHVFIGVRYSPFRGSVADLFISPDGRAIFHLHASAQIGERRVQETSGRWENPEFIWGNTTDWYVNEIRWNQRHMDQLIKEGRGRDEAQAMSFYRYDGFEFQIRASKFASKSWLFRVEAPIPPDWEHPIVFPAGTSMTKTDGWLRLILD